MVPSPSTPSPPEVRDFARADAVPMKRCSGSSRRRENLQLPNRREDVEQRNTSLPTSGGSEKLQEDNERVERALLTPRGDKLVERAMRSTSVGEGKRREELGHTVVPSPKHRHRLKEETSPVPKDRRRRNTASYKEKGVHRHIISKHTPKGTARGLTRWTGR